MPDTGVDEDSGTQDAGDADAGAPECAAGEMRTASCGFCGTVAQSCGDLGRWEDTSACLGEGECAEGSVETRDLAMCGQEQRLCEASCSWSAWQEVRAPGACEAGTTRTSGESCPAGQLRDERCSVACEWEALTACSDPCGGSTPIRTLPEWQREVCIPAGDFIRGSTHPTATNAQPVSTVTLSAYYIDAYPVTYRRYQLCIDAGACSAPMSEYVQSGAAFLDFPIQGVTHQQASEFCAWDGGRVLPTGAQWEKAARGPAPRTNDFIWGASWDCAIAPIESCGYMPMPPYMSRPLLARDPYDALPAAVSYYGVLLQGVSTREWTREYWCPDLYTDPSSRTDPECTLSSPGVRSIYHEVRGWARSAEHSISLRYGLDPDSPAHGFRCARPGI